MSFPLAGRHPAACWSLAAALGAAALLCASVANAEPTDAEKKKAAEEFDAGLELFERAEYGAAARAFLRADALAPNAEALINAIAAARRVNDHLLVVEATERSVQRGETDPTLAAMGREAQAEAIRHLARVDVRCEPAPCQISVDGVDLDPGPRFLLPGHHRFEARGVEDAVAAETQTLHAGTTYRVVLRPTKDAAVAIAATVETKPLGGAPQAAPAADNGKPAPGEDDTSSGVSPWWFYGGVAVTGVLVGVTTWSGIDALVAKNSLPDPAPVRDREAAKDKIDRTDILLAVTAVAAVATGTLGLFVVDWGDDGDAKVSVAPTYGGATLSAQARF